MRIMSCDSVYTQAIAKAAAGDGGWVTRTGEDRVARVLAQRFGTWDSLGFACRALGHDATDWLLGAVSDDADDAALMAPGFDVKIVQDVGRRSPEFWRAVRDTCGALVGIVNHKHPGLETLRAFSLTTTAFPHQVAEIEAAGIPCRYLPCAFDPRHLNDAVGPRDLPVTFCGSLGFGNVWDAGTHAISAVAERVPGFHWWGPRVGRLTDGLQKTWRGEVYGRAYVEILRRSVLAINRQGSTTVRQTTNMRNFEATGCGAVLLTEASENLGTMFSPWEECVPFGDPNELVTHVRQLLIQPSLTTKIAAAGQRRTLESHTYARRAEVLLEWIRDVRR